MQVYMLRLQMLMDRMQGVVLLHARQAESKAYGRIVRN